MSLITWSDDLSVNIKQFDDQHQGLVNLINELYDAMSAGKGSAVIGKILSGLADYTVYHFKTEEDVFQKHGYPGLEQHKFEHDNLTKQVLDFKEQFDAGKAVVSIELMKFLKDWLTNHILAGDMAYKPFLNDKGVF